MIALKARDLKPVKHTDDPLEWVLRLHQVIEAMVALEERIEALERNRFSVAAFDTVDERSDELVKQARDLILERARDLLGLSEA